MSKERARRRAVAQAERERQQAAEARRDRRRDRRQARIDGLRARVPRRRRVARIWSRRSKAQRATVALVALAVVVLTFLLTDSWSIRIAVLALTAISGPALTTLALGRSRG